MVLKNIAIFSLVVFAFMQWTSLQHDIEHMQEVMYVAHCSDEKKDDDKDINDMVMSGLNVQSVIESNIYSGLEAKLKFTTWKKV